MTRLQVELDDFVDAARLLHGEVAEPVGYAVSTLAETLSGCEQMAGDDDGGRQWAAAYDKAAASLLSATSRYASGAFATAGMFGRSAINYANADTASTASANPDEEPVTARLPATTDVTPHPDPPSAAGNDTGGAADQPWGWSLIAHLICLVWPNGDQARLRRAAHAFRTCATAVDHAAEQPTRASILFARDRLPEVDDVIAVCRGITDRGRALARAHRALARSCDDLAEHLDHCHSEVEAELRQLAVETGTLQIAGGILAAVTFGIAEIPTQITQTALLAKVAARVGELIDRFLTAVRATHALIPAITERVQGMLRDLDTLANAQLVAATTSRVDRLGRYSATARGVGGASAEVRSAARLQAEANNLRRGGRGREFIDATDQTHILYGDELKAGGHLARPGYSNPKQKTLFPSTWNADRVLDNVADIVRSPATVWRTQSGTGGLFQPNGAPAVWRAWEVRDGVRIRVVWQPATGRVITAFPDDAIAKGALVP